MRLLGFGKEKLPSVIQDPFAVKQVDNISVQFYPRGFWGNSKPQAMGRIKFKNGNTEAEQKFEGESFDDVVLKIKATLENL